MARFSFAFGLLIALAPVARSQPPLPGQPFGKLPSLRAGLAGFPKPFDPKAKPVQLSDDAATKLCAEIADPDANKRLAAMLRVGPGAPDSVIVALLGRLSDPYVEQTPTFDGPSSDYVLRWAATECVIRLGPPAVPPVLRFAQDKVNRRVRNECVRILGKLGHHPDAEKWLRELADTDKSDDGQMAVLAAAEALGRDGAGVLRALIGRKKPYLLARQYAMDALGKSGDPKSDPKLLRPFLASADAQERAVAVTALGNLRDAESLPAFEKMARDPNENGHVRHKATERALALLDKANGDKLLLDVVKTAREFQMSYVAERVAERKLVAAVPHLLAGLTDPYTDPREKADAALRALTGRPDGVGYDPQKGNAELWRAVVEKK